MTSWRTRMSTDGPCMQARSRASANVYRNHLTRFCPSVNLAFLAVMDTTPSRQQRGHRVSSGRLGLLPSGRPTGKEVGPLTQKADESPDQVDLFPINNISLPPFYSILAGGFVPRWRQAKSLGLRKSPDRRQILLVPGFWTRNHQQMRCCLNSVILPLNR